MRCVRVAVLRGRRETKMSRTKNDMFSRRERFGSRSFLRAALKSDSLMNDPTLLHMCVGAFGMDPVDFNDASYTRRADPCSGTHAGSKIGSVLCFPPVRARLQWFSSPRASRTRICVPGVARVKARLRVDARVLWCSSALNCKGAYTPDPSSDAAHSL